MAATIRSSWARIPIRRGAGSTVAAGRVPVCFRVGARAGGAAVGHVRVHRPIMMPRGAMTSHATSADPA